MIREPFCIWQISVSIWNEGGKDAGKCYWNICQFLDGWVTLHLSPSPPFFMILWADAKFSPGAQPWQTGRPASAPEWDNMDPRLPRRSSNGLKKDYTDAFALTDAYAVTTSLHQAQSSNMLWNIYMRTTASCGLQVRMSYYLIMSHESDVWRSVNAERHLAGINLMIKTDLYKTLSQQGAIKIFIWLYRGPNVYRLII